MSEIVTGCLHPTLTDHFPILSGIQPAEHCRQGATLSMVYRGSLDPDHILYDLLSGLSDVHQERLRSRRSFVSTAQILLNNLAELGIRPSHWTNYRWDAEYCENRFRIYVFIPRISARPVGVSLPLTAWVKFNHPQTAVERFYLSMHKRGLAPSPNCECSALNKPQTTF